ncbi:MAG: DUF1049 domain-containing protein [Proteobacteria bacterium]|nr:DUF1049 domain-containing protein [Pseudomonadota bacterium]
MKILSRALFLLFVVLGVLIAVSNSERVPLSLWPFPYSLQTPLYLLMVAMLLLGVLAGLVLGWWAGRRHRRRAREQGKEAARLDREVTRLREMLAERTASSADAPPRDQKAIDRQAALVAPDLVAPPRRPLS